MEWWSWYVGVVYFERLAVDFEGIALLEEVLFEGYGFPVERPVEGGYPLVLGRPPLFRFHYPALFP